MGFRNSILAGEQLVRTGIRSENYVAGVAGWRIARDGTAELNDTTIRGELIVGVGDPRIEVVPDYNGFGPAVVFYPDGGGDPAWVQHFDPGGGIVMFSPDGNTALTVADDLIRIAAGGTPTGDLQLAAGSTISFETRPQLDVPGLNPGLPIFAGTYGVESGFNTDANARYTFTHGLGAVPSAVLCTAGSPDSGGTILAQLICRPDLWTATQATVRCFNHLGAPLNSTGGLTFSWIALP